ncbi:MAG: hypothetical protein VX642_02435 [Bdellovibrionota bacterium]|nr:hypothetical protein [Bdellovibrionota bacterium]
MLLFGFPSYANYHCSSLSKAICDASKDRNDKTKDLQRTFLERIQDRLSKKIQSSFPINSVSSYQKLRRLLPSIFNQECMFDEESSEFNTEKANNCIKKLSNTLSNVVLTYEEYYERELDYFFDLNEPILKSYARSSFIRRALKEIKLWIANSDFYKEEEKTIQDSFDLTKVMFTNYINKKVTNIELRKKALYKLESVQLDNSKCVDDKDFFLYWSDEDIPPNAEYSRISNTVRLCPSLLSIAYSQYSYVYILAHEIAHAFDSCSFNYKLDNNKSGLFPNLNQCLMHSNSIGADPIERKYYYFCGSEVLTEAFANWFSGEILGDLFEMKNFKKLNINEKLLSLNIGLRMCNGEQRMFKLNQHHHSLSEVFDKIILQNPKIKDAFYCQDERSENAYCSGYSTTPGQ